MRQNGCEKAGTIAAALVKHGNQIDDDVAALLRKRANIGADVSYLFCAAKRITKPLMIQAAPSRGRHQRVKAETVLGEVACVGPKGLVVKV